MNYSDFTGEQLDLAQASQSVQSIMAKQAIVSHMIDNKLPDIQSLYILNCYEVCTFNDLKIPDHVSYKMNEWKKSPGILGDLIRDFIIEVNRAV